MAVKCHLQRFDKVTNTMAYSVPSDVIRDAFLMQSKNDIFAFRNYYDKAEKKLVVVYKTIDKKTGTTSEFHTIASIPGPNRLVSFSCTADKLLINFENIEWYEKQDLELKVFDLGTLNIIGSYSVSKFPELSNGFVFITSVDDQGNVTFVYTPNASKEKWYVLKYMKFPSYIHPTPGDFFKSADKWREGDRSLNAGYIKKGESKAFVIPLDLGKNCYPDNYNTKVSYAASEIVIDGIYFDQGTEPNEKKCEGGFFRIKLDPAAQSVSAKHTEPFTADLSEKLKNAGIGRDLPCERYYNLLHTIEDEGTVYFVYQVFWTPLGHVSARFFSKTNAVMNKNGKMTIGTMMPFNELRGNLIVLKMNASTSKFEWMKMIPYNFDLYGQYYSLDIGVSAVASKGKLYLVHLDNIKNSSNLENFDAVRVTGFTPKGASLVCVTLDANGAATKQTVFQNTDELYTCPSSLVTPLPGNKIMIHSRGKKEKEGFDQYGYIQIK